ncbi:MAG: amidohydrolase family protein [Planctomycetota bacterium]
MRLERSIRRLCLLALGFAGAAIAQNSPVAYTNAKLIPIDGEEIERGTLVIEGGKIVAVGPTGRVTIPRGADEINMAGNVIMPGLVDTHSHIGGVGGADSSGPIQPGVAVYDSINVRSGGFRRAVAGGLTSLNIMPGSGHLSSGKTVYVKLRFFEDNAPSTIDDITYRFDDGSPMGGLKMANGTNPMRDGGAGGFPGTRGKAAFLVREQFIKAREYAAKVAAAGDDESMLPPRDLHLETLAEVLAGERVVHHHTHRHDDISTVLRLKEEFGFEVVLHHLSEGWMVADEIAAAGAACSVIMIDSPGGKLEAARLSYETGKILEEAGANVSFHTDDWITDSRYFFRSAALAVRAGMSREGGLRSLTLSGAEQLDIEDRVGSLTVGKDADFIVLDGDPFSVYTKVLETYVEGRRVFDRNNPEHRLYAVGGYGAAHDTEPYFCCYDAFMRRGNAGMRAVFVGGGE